MPTTLHENRPSAGIGVVEVQKPMVFCDFEFPRDPLRGSAWSRCKNHVFFAISAVLARPSAGIGVVEVQKPSFFCDFCGARATAKTHVFLRFLRCSRDPLRGSAWRNAKTHGVFLRFLRCPRNPLRGSARSRCKNSWFFCNFCCSNWSSGVVSWFARLLPEPAGRGFDSSLVRGRASQDATCILKQLAQSNLRRATCAEQVAQSNLRRPTCTDQFAQSALPRATCAEQLTQGNLHRATCTEQLAQSNLQGGQFAQSNLQGATCRDQLAGATCAEQLARSNLRRATCVEQLAQTNLHRPVCAEHLAWRCLALASQMLRGGTKNASCSVGPTSLAMLCFRANRGLAHSFHFISFHFIQFLSFHFISFPFFSFHFFHFFLSFFHSFIHSFFHSFTHLLTHSFISIHVTSGHFVLSRSTYCQGALSQKCKQHQTGRRKAEPREVMKREHQTNEPTRALS